jgi:hypothetical protein
MNDIVKTEVANSPLAIIDRALSNGVPPEQLGQLLDLQEALEPASGGVRRTTGICVRLRPRCPRSSRAADNPHTRSKSRGWRI